MSAQSRADIPNYNMPKTDTPVEGKKRRVNSKSKGNGFEGTIAKKLSAALAPLNFIRTPGSGARVGGKNFETIGKLFGEDALKIFVGVRVGCAIVAFVAMATPLRINRIRPAAGNSATSRWPIAIMLALL